MRSEDGRLGPGEEFDAIRELIARFGDTSSGIGDDAAVLDIPRGERLVISTDAAVENRHFRAEWLEPREIGYRAVTAALSDLAAMAAHPLAVLLAINLPDAWRARLPAIGDGAADAVRGTGAKIVGGNLTAASELCLTTTVVGTAFAPLTRSGARPGDRLYVTGRFGGPISALAALTAGRSPDPACRERFARPIARLAEARWLHDRGATAAIDISDGLSGDALHLAAASGVGVVIHLERLPLISGVDARSGARGGEEYELLVASPPLDTAEFERRFALPLSEVGEIAEGSDVLFLDHGRRIEVGGGHDHLRK